MPFIDFQKLEGITVEDLKNAHIADPAMQDQYGLIEQLSTESPGVAFHFAAKYHLRSARHVPVLRTSYRFNHDVL